MAKLVLVFNDRVLSETELDKEYITIGRAPDNDIVVDNLAVSGHHARVLTILNDSFVEDLHSTNGTYVDNRLVKKHALRNGEEIMVGKHVLRYENEQASDDTEFERTMIIRPDSMGMPEEDGSESLSASAQDRLRDEIQEQRDVRPQDGKAWVRVISGTNAGKEMELTKALTTLGRPKVQVAAISRRANGCYLIHVDGGANKRRPRVNEETMMSTSLRLQENDVIEVAGVKLEFFTT